VAGLGPAIHEPPNRKRNLRVAVGWVYFLSNRPNGVLYVGVTDNLIRRIWEHREGVIDGFTKRYGLKRLIYFERYEDIRKARQREQNLKHYPRAWKIRLVLLNNPNWNDLYESSV
jgi:putative endonuclease